MSIVWTVAWFVAGNPDIASNFNGWNVSLALLFVTDIVLADILIDRWKRRRQK